MNYCAPCIEAGRRPPLGMSKRAWRIQKAAAKVREEELLKIDNYTDAELGAALLAAFGPL